jgi:formylglycine-generating enzyme
MRSRLSLVAPLFACALVGCRGADEHPGMRRIPAGEFMMGSRLDDPSVREWDKPSEQPPHAVYVSAFYIDEHEVTNTEYERWMPDHRPQDSSPCADCPVVRVTWFEAGAYCAAQGKRLPTEAEWEKAAKGGADRDPEPLGDYAWYAANSITRAQPVAQKRSNGYGLYDMLGNVREWTADWYDEKYYALGVHDDPKGPQEGQRRVERGGAFFLSAPGVRTTIRYNHPPSIHLYFLGFRCARDA